jgi:hypothetical protein
MPLGPNYQLTPLTNQTAQEGTFYTSAGSGRPLFEEGWQKHLRC